MDIVQNNSRLYCYAQSSETFKLLHALCCSECRCVPGCEGRRVGLELDRFPVQGVPPNIRQEHHEDPRIAGNPAEIRTGYFPNTRFTALQPRLLNQEDGRGSISSSRSTDLYRGHRVETGFGPIQSPIQWVLADLLWGVKRPADYSVLWAWACMELYLHSPVRLNTVLLKQRD
jgi:hypothetical protein